MTDSTTSAEVAGSLPAPAKKSALRVWGPRVALMIAGIAVGYLIFTQVIQRLGSFEEGVQAALGVPAIWFAAIVVAAVFSIAVYPLTAPAAIPGLKYKVAFIDRQGGLLISSGIPFGGGPLAVGVQYAMLDTYRVPQRRAAAAVAADALWTYMMTFGTPAIALLLLFALERRTVGSTFEYIAIIAAVIFAISVVVIFIAVRSESGAERIGALAARPIRALFRLIKRTPPDVVTSIVGFHETASDMVRTRWKQITVTNLLAQLSPMLVILAAMAGLGAFDGDVTFLEVLVAFSVAMLLASVPLAPGGLGTVDAALIYLLVLFGVSSAQATAVDIIWRAFMYFPQMVVGIVALIWWVIDKAAIRKRLATGTTPSSPNLTVSE